MNIIYIHMNIIVCVFLFCFIFIEEMEMKIRSDNTSPINNSTSTIDNPNGQRSLSSRTILTEIVS